MRHLYSGHVLLSSSLLLQRTLHFFHHPMTTTTTTDTLRHRQHRFISPMMEPKGALSWDFFCFLAPADIDEDDDADVTEDASSL